MIKLNVKSGEKKIAYKSLSAFVKILIDDKKLASSLTNLEPVYNISLSELQKANFLSDKCDILRVAKPGGKPDEIILLKAKVGENFHSDYFRNKMASLITSLKNEQIKNLHISLPPYELFKDYYLNEEYYLRTFIEGVYYGTYSFDGYKTGEKTIKEMNVHFYANNENKLNTAIGTTKILMDAVFFARDLQNIPSNDLTPELFAEKIKNEFIGISNVKITVMDEKELKKKKMGGILAVGSGSNNAPRLIVLEYNNDPKKGLKKVAVVGKGVTFDSGGISIKPAADMWEMKADMGGGAVTAALVKAVAKAKLPVSVVGIIPAVENMPSGSAFKPGDIIKTASGKTIEIDNTDAEGRIILADALHLASTMQPDFIIDLATLTGACVVALGPFVAGLFSNNDKLKNDLFSSSKVTFERIWELPIWEDFNKLIESDVADVKNLGGRWGGAITAAKFLEKFIDKKDKWAHLDIAGPTFPHTANEYSKTYMTGFGVRLLFEFLKQK